MERGEKIMRSCLATTEELEDGGDVDSGVLVLFMLKTRDLQTPFLLLSNSWLRLLLVHHVDLLQKIFLDILHRTLRVDHHAVDSDIHHLHHRFSPNSGEISADNVAVVAVVAMASRLRRPDHQQSLVDHDGSLEGLAHCF